MKPRNNISIIILIICIFPFYAMGQVNGILEEGDLNGYQLISQKNVDQINIIDSSLIAIIKQIWRKSGEEYYVHYLIYGNPNDATIKTSYYANSNAGLYKYGSTTGEVLGDFSWAAVDGSSLHFQYNNFGIKVFKPINFNDNDREILFKIAELVLSRIKEDYFYSNKLNENQILSNRAQNIVEDVDSVINRFGLLLNKSIESKWSVNEKSIKNGNRNQWKGNNSFFSLDFIEIPDSNALQEALIFRSKISQSPIVDIDSNFSKELEECFQQVKTKNSYNNFSFIINKESLLMHFYYYKEGDIDKEMIHAIVDAIKADD